MGAEAKGFEGGSNAKRNAVEWVVENGSDHAVEGATVASWEEWVGHPGNEVEYVAVIETVERIRQLPAPALESREALIEDALADAAAVGP